MNTEQPYKVLWRSAIDSDQTTAREEEFTNKEDAEAFVMRIEASRNREVLRKVGF